MLNPQLEPFLAVWNEKWKQLPAGAKPADRRALFEVIARDMRLPTPRGVETDAEHWIPSAAGDVRVRVFRHGNDSTQPCLIYMHGGAWMQGSPETHWDITSRIAAANRQTVISVDYALAPEHPFPAAITQCQDVVRWVAANAEKLSIDPARIAVGGDSAGANLAASLALFFRGSDIALSGQLLVYPAVDFEMQRPAYVENATAPLLSVAGMPAVNAMYCPNPADLRNPMAAPMLADNHADLPPAYIAVAQNDPLRDDGLDYARKLQDSGVAVTVDTGEGLIHGYLRAMEYCEASRTSLSAMCAWLDRINSRP
ncbi:alpha/beta hydrolase [Devosia neptuniae]|uniref:alpha/beta hydrolase n=1 Tax=Devosia TaxID=46913 RepID=UPI0022AFECF9|nr:alpha/beta hydrolase [Devosia neptuniae]MCZ4345238.1 alpha/beta hydrolase [Devosia neptuniae]